MKWEIRTNYGKGEERDLERDQVKEEGRGSLPS